LYSRTVDGEETLQLTETAHGVLDFSVNLKEAAVVYTEIRQDGGTDLRWIDLVSGEDQLLLSCRANWRCQAPTISPGFEAVAFERSPLEAGPEAQWVFGDPSVWMLEMKVDSDPARISPSGHITSQPRWSPKGQLAYYDATLKAIQIVDPFAEPTPSKIRSIPSDLGLIGEWSPNGSSLLYPGVVILDPSPGESDLLQGSASAFYSHLFRVNLDTGIRMDLSGSQFGLVEDAGPVYSPDGLFIAFTRKFLDEDRWTPGRQLWIMRTDGTEPRQITRDPTYHHSALDWNPESNGLVFLRTNQNDFAQTPEVWLYDVKRDQIRPFVVGGYFPQWTP
jgi:dipeptidyl aminopeptidase/acylaminoacyl peptidase